MPDPVQAVRRVVVQHRADAAPATCEDAVALEEPLEIRVEGRPVAVTMRTPGHDEDLVAGFLLTEGVIASAEDLFEISTCPATTDTAGNTVDVLLRRPETFDFAALTRHVFTSSSCGLCGKATLAALSQRHPPLPPAPALSLHVLHRALTALERTQTTFHATGGLHAAALFDATGRLTVVREDVGRHNAVDKVLGHALCHREAPTAGLLVSGRVSFEIMHKALAGRIALVAAVSAPTSLAIDFALAHGQTLVGFLRPGRVNLYAGALAEPA
jgi:FdhD protein